MRYFQHRRQLALQAGVIMFDQRQLSNRLTLLLGTYVRAKQMESEIVFSFTDDRGNTLAFLDFIKERLLSHDAKEEAAYIASVMADSSVHSLYYEEIIVNRIRLMLMEWPEDKDLTDAWAKCPVNAPRLTEVMEEMWPDLPHLESSLNHL